jgi:thioredoxin-like negative regulator of GroEL
LNLAIQSIPTIIIFKEGSEKSRFIGFQPAGTLEKILEHLTEK